VSENPLRAKAHYEAQEALRRGKLKMQPCEKCGEKKVIAHHEDYSKPLEIVWLCRIDHIKRHKDMKTNKIIN
jgi:ribosomal protein S27AE